MIQDPRDPDETPGDFRFSEAAVVAVFQARHEAIHLGTADVTPGHLALGVLKALPAERRARLLPDPAGYARLCRRLGAGTAAAPPIPEEVAYTAAARSAFATARAEAGPAEIEPLHLLVGALCHGDAATIAALEEAGLPLEAVRRRISAGEGQAP
ncbi:MAG: hypothetical protein KA180_01410 [Gemmatimonadales bacterium]|nr:hypothetical protein [Gemmatimonadales bacterium]MBP9202080.1 hypothetical protein [Gemmatimonadales bacterium]